MKKTIAVDFDGTVVTHEYPEVGTTVPNAVETLKRLNSEGVRLILWTMRGNEYLQDAVDWFKANEIELFGVNENPEQSEWTQSPKAYAQLYIDDAGINCPLLHSTFAFRPFVDWFKVEKILEEKGFLSAK